MVVTAEVEVSPTTEKRNMVAPEVHTVARTCLKMAGKWQGVGLWGRPLRSQVDDSPKLQEVKKVNASPQKALDTCPSRQLQ